MLGYRLIYLFCFMAALSFGQAKDQIERFDQLVKEAEVYEEVELYGKCLDKLKSAMNVARRNKNREQEIDVAITIAELLRKSEDFDRGLGLLRSLHDSEKYPKLHVRKLSRFAALYNQGVNLSEEEKKDTLFKYLYQGIEFAIAYKMPLEEASMRNELGFVQMRTGMQEEGMNNLLTAKRIFQENDDLHNEAWVMANMLENYVARDLLDKADSLSLVLTNLIQDSTWHAVKSRVYMIIAMRNIKDTVAYSHWLSLANGATVETIRERSYHQMSSFRSLYDTEKYQKEAEVNAKSAKEKTLELAIQRNQSNTLIGVVVGLFVIAMAAIFWVRRERRLKQKLHGTMEEVNVLNERYHMLIVESNHRIKNNLQMIISMLKYSSKGLDKSNSNALNRMAGKISTISALHKHLYADVHNEYVSMNTYFKEIVKLYNVMLSNDFEVIIDIDDVEIRSERIIYFGLIFNEMLSNTIEHNTSENKRISIEAKSIQEEHLFTYKDDSKHAENAPDGTGRLLIKQLVDRVKGKDYQFDKESGEYTFKFNKE